MCVCVRACWLPRPLAGDPTESKDPQATPRAARKGPPGEPTEPGREAGERSGDSEVAARRRPYASQGSPQGIATRLPGPPAGGLLGSRPSLAGKPATGQVTSRWPPGGARMHRSRGLPRDPQGRVQWTPCRSRQMFTAAWRSRQLLPARPPRDACVHRQ